MSDVATEFVILTGGRTGSTWVMSVLNSHPDVACYNELFHTGEHTLRVPPRGRQDYLYYDHYVRENAHGLAGAVTRPRYWKAYLDGLYAPRDDVSAIGFKLLYLQAKAHPWLLPALSIRRVLAIHLVRDNPLDILVSQDMTRARGSFHAGEAEDVHSVQVTLDPATLERRIGREEMKIRAGRRSIAALRLPTIELRYDDLLADPAKEFDRVFTRLGVQPAKGELTTEVKRLNEAPYRESIANFEEVAQILTSSGHGDLLKRRA